MKNNMKNTLINYIVKRNGEPQLFDPVRIYRAIEKAFNSEEINDPDTVQMVTHSVVESSKMQADTQTEPLDVELVQDIVEEELMNHGHHKVARNYILYREEHKRVREEKVLSQIKDNKLEIKVNDQETIIFDPKVIETRLRHLGSQLIKISIVEMVDSVSRQVYDKITQKEINLLILGAARDRIEKHYDYSYLAARIAINDMTKPVLGALMDTEDALFSYETRFNAYIDRGIALEILRPELKDFNLKKLAQAIVPQRDQLFNYLGIQILQDRYLLRDRSENHQIFELPQWFWMRVAMGLAIKEPKDKNEWAIKFYNTLSQLDLISSTPTLFNSGTIHSQMSSCYLNTVDDSLDHIFKVHADNAKLSKWAGGIGTDWSNIRATGSKIKGTNGVSQGVIPFIKIFNDVALAVNQGGKRKGAMCAYMEVWHLDYEQFLELKKNTGDERRRAHDINTASWIPDLFMKRMLSNQKWTLFCPSETPDLHDLYGAAFEKKYEFYESQNLPRAKTVNALDLWRKMLTMLYETGHPWVTFKDVCNIRSPQDHVGVVHSSNLCTEITLNTDSDETAVCNLASVNLSHMIINGQLDDTKLSDTIDIGIRMLDNVIDNNFYPTEEAERANLKHRAIGLGMMGYQDAIYKMNFTFDSDQNITFADQSMEKIAYYAISASCKLAQERGSYETYKGSKWDRGIFPIDTLTLLEQERGETININRDAVLDWDSLKEKLKQHGLRNSNIMAIAPTATIANIAGVYPCTEPAYKNMYMKENLSGNFIVMNRFLIDDLEKLNLWNERIIQQLKLNNGSVSAIKEIPDSLKAKYKETFEIDMKWIVLAATRRSKWVDQSMSTNIFMNTKSGKALSDVYIDAWKRGLKTTYYLRTVGASQVTKATVSDVVELPEEPAQQQQQQQQQQQLPIHKSETNAETVAAALYTVSDEGECDACQ
jgi:ribonucleoside-diphosphate reductase alpha chain